MLSRLALAIFIGTLVAPTIAAQSTVTLRNDALGDPLPEGAVARLGTLRLKHQPELDATVDIAHFSLNGKMICSLVLGRGSIRLWDADTGRQLVGPWSADDQRFTAIAFSPDSGLLAAASGGNSKGGKVKVAGPSSATIVLWAIAQGKVLHKLTHEGQVARAVAFSDGGKTLLSASDGVFRWWNVNTGKEQRSWKPFGDEMQPIDDGATKTKTFANCAISPDGQFGAVQISWRIDKGGPAKAQPKGQPIGDQEVVGFDLKTSKITWQASAKAAPKGENSQAGGVSFAYSADSKRVAVALGSNRLELRASVTGKLIALPPLEVSSFLTERHGSLGLSPDGVTLGVPGKDSQVMLWNPDSPATFRKFSGRLAQYWGNSTRYVTFSPSGKTVLVGGDADLQHYDVTTLQEVRPWEGHRGWVDQVAFSADGKQLLTGSGWANARFQEVLTWDVPSWKRLQWTSVRTPPWPNFGNPSLNDAFYLGKTGTDRFALFARNSGELLARFSVPQQQSVTSDGIFSTDGRFLMLPGKDDNGKNVDKLYAVPSGKLLCLLPRFPRPNPMTSARPVVFSANARLVAVFGLEDGLIHVVETATGKLLQRLGKTREARDDAQLILDDERRQLHVNLAFSHDAKLLASWISGDNGIRIWDLATGKECMVLPADLMRTSGKQANTTGPVNPNNSVQLAWSPDGRLLAVGDTKIRLVEMRTLKVRHELPGHEGALRALAFSPDGRLLASCSADTTILIWDALNFDQAPAVAKALSRAELDGHWAMLLHGDDAAKAFAAIRVLSAIPDDTVALIQAKVKLAPAVDSKLIDDLIGQLDDRQYKVRQKATAELLAIGDHILPRIEKVLADNPPLETRLRLQDIRTRSMSLVLQGERLQAFRAVEILERIGTPEARQVLQALAEGAPDALLTLQAEAALARLKRS